MTLVINQELPNTTFSYMEGDKILSINLKKITTKRKVLIIGMPGAFTRTCSSTHLPGLIKVSESIYKRGVDEIVCVVVNDVHVAKAWDEITGAKKAGIKILADVEAKFSKSIGLNFSAPKIGFFDRLQRVAIFSTDNKVDFIKLEKDRGVCNLTSGEHLLSFLNL